MTDVVVVEFPSEAKAEEVRERLLEMQREYLIDLEDAIIVIKQADGRIKLNQPFHPALGGAVYGSMLGLIVISTIKGGSEWAEPRGSAGLGPGPRA